MTGPTGGDWPPLANLVYGGVTELMTLDLAQGPTSPSAPLPTAMTSAIAGVVLSAGWTSGPGAQLSGALTDGIAYQVAPSGPWGPQSPLTVALLQSFALEVQIGLSGPAGGLISALRQQILGPSGQDG